MRTVILPGGLLIASACAFTDAWDVTRAQAAADFSCADDRVLLRRSDTGFRESTYDVSACGHSARYLCVWENGVGYHCVHLAPTTNR